ncbi:MAG: tetratricopeptide repeat protein [Gammaproteobacteria bacterium]|nr:tetratricopeptide repeat protein [Gammaproteobacteria bacterium]
MPSHSRSHIKNTLLLLLCASLCTLTSTTAAAADYVGAQVCQQCHQDQFQAWQGSHHDWAMLEPTAESVLGDFDNRKFTYNGITSRFFTTAGEADDGEARQYWVETDNAEGKLEKFPVAYTFGFYPLQQYLIGFADGRYQALSIAWDSRPKSEGGQRWFHLNPDETVDHRDPLHWTGLYYNWNNRCADCHSTNLQKNYQPDSDTYATTWSEINVACEACHGPGSDHLTWTELDNQDDPFKGLQQQLSAASIAEVLTPIPPGGKDLQKSAAQIAACGSCHSRRGVIGDITAPGNYHNKHQLSLLEEPLYYADGQIRDEVYVLGSFLQSKMYHQGVTCTHCHEPHSLELRQPGNQLCAQCHNPNQFDTTAHHQHPQGSSGSQCVNCHMPETTYMVVDPRRDHSIRIPRPDLSATTGAPNACVMCHQDRDNEWASKALAAWLKQGNKQLPPHPGAALAAAPNNELFDKIRQLANSEQPAIVRATALQRLRDIASPQTMELARQHFDSKDELVRAAAISLTDALPYPTRLQSVLPKLSDPIKAVRMAAVQVLLSPELAETKAQLPAAQQTVVERALAEYLKMLEMHQDTAAGLNNLGQYYLAVGDFEQAEARYQRSIDMEPYLTGAIINLTDLYRMQGRDDAALKLLQQALTRHRQRPEIQHSLGLTLVRGGAYDKALSHLQQAAELAPDGFRYGYVYAVALHSTQHYAEAIREASRLLALQPQNPELLNVGLDSAMRSQQWSEALRFALQLQRLNPGDPQLQGLVKHLQDRILGGGF